MDIFSTLEGLVTYNRMRAEFRRTRESPSRAQLLAVFCLLYTETTAEGARSLAEELLSLAHLGGDEAVISYLRPRFMELPELTRKRLGSILLEFDLYPKWTP